MPDFGKIAGDTMSKVMGTDAGSMGLSDEEMSSMEDRLRAGEMSFDDFLKQVQVMQKGASVQAMLGKMGGAGMTDQQLKDGQKKLEKYGEYIKFMDAEERQDTSLLIDEMAQARKGAKAPRMERIAEAAGVTVEDIGRFLLEFKMMKGAAFKMANGESPESIKQSMLEEQAAGGTEQVLNRQQRRMAKKKSKKKPKASGGFGR